MRLRLWVLPPNVCWIWVINEPLGGAHRDMQMAMKNVKAVLEEQLREAQSIPMADLLSRRFDRIMAYGQFTEK